MHLVLTSGLKTCQLRSPSSWQASKETMQVFALQGSSCSHQTGSRCFLSSRVTGTIYMCLFLQFHPKTSFNHCWSWTFANWINFCRARSTPTLSLPLHTTFMSKVSINLADVFQLSTLLSQKFDKNINDFDYLKWCSIEFSTSLSILMVFSSHLWHLLMFYLIFT